MPLFRPRSEAEKRARLERLIVAEFARHGSTGELVHDPDDPLNTSLRSATGSVWGFANVMLRCLNAPERDWNGIVRHHVSVMLTPSDELDLSNPAGRGALRARIVSEDITRHPWFEYARPYAPGLVELLFADLPDRVATINDEQLAGHDIEELRALGRRNLALEEVPPPREYDGGVLAIHGTSMFVASQLLRPGFVASLLGPDDHGIAAAIPDRHTLLYAPVSGPDSMPTIGRVAQLAAVFDRDTRPGGILGEYALFVTPVEVQRISWLKPDGGLSIVADGAFGRAIGAGD